MAEIVVDEQAILFEIHMPMRDPERVIVIERSPDENASRLAFDACRKVLTNLVPRPAATLELFLGATPLDVFVQTRQGEEFAPDKVIES